MDKWTELRTAYQVARLGTVSAAAEFLGFHRATVNRHIDVLEKEFGVRIFIRHSRGYALTEVGQEVLRAVEKTEDIINEMAARVRGGSTQLEGEIKVAIVAPLADLIMKSIVEFRLAHPHCRVCIIASEEFARLEYGEAHVALRVGPKPEHPDYVVTTFATVRFNLYAHDSYVQQYGLPDDINNMKEHRFVIPPFDNKLLSFMPWINEHVNPEQVAVSTNHIWINLQAVEEGLGIGFLSHYAVEGRDDIHKVLQGEHEDWIMTIWQVTHVDLHRTQKVQALLQSFNASRPTRD